MSASFAKADILQGGLHVRYVPLADIGARADQVILWEEIRIPA